MTTRSFQTRPLRRPAFTLVELVVGIVIVAMLAAAASAAIGQLVRSRTAAVSHRQAFSRASDAAARIALDLAAVTRDMNLSVSKVQVTSSGGPKQARDELLLLVRSTRPVRGLSEITGAAEGADQELQYRVKDDGGVPTLWRRADVALDGIVDGGGIASPIISRVQTLSLEAYDGSAWKESWDSDGDGMPHAVRVVVTASSDDGKSTATARRVVAIDRVPLAPRSEEGSSGSSSGSSSSSSGSGGGGGGQ
ncbi:MAG: type II secretion system protein GspJ [Phycisphaerales bacterium]